MDRTRLERIKDLLEQLISLPESGDEAARNAFLSRAGVDADIRSEVLRLLAADSRARGKTAGQSAAGQAATADSLQNLPVSDATSAPTVPPDQPAAGGGGGGGGGGGANRNAGSGSGGGRSTTPRTTSDSRDPEHIGPYRVLKRLGGGGMGVVYLCIRDDEQITRRVAVKLIKKGMDSEAVLKRFELEKQVLSNLSHPNIARVLDAGMSDDHRPYFVMDYVEGQTLLDYCDSNQLSIADRLKIFMKLCGAVHAAHQNLIVHRDIKPGNIIVGVDGEPKLLDFGIAKLLNPSNAGGAGIDIATLEFQRLMTPEYASPEQVKGDPVRTTSDIYSLGVLLYELLTGLRPYNFRSRLMEEIKRVICDEEPQRPSTAVAWDAAPTATPTTGLGTGTVDAGALRTRAKLRSTKPDTLKRELSNDLDDIVLMAMRKVPSRRYASAEQMAEDIRRHLTGQTVIARPETMRYVVGKFVRRNKAGVATVAAFALIVATALVVVSIALSAEKSARQRAEIAQQNAAKANANLLAVTQGYFKNVGPLMKSLAGAHVAQRSAAEQFVNGLESQLKDPTPENRPLRVSLGRAYDELGLASGGGQSASSGDRPAALKYAQKAIEVLQQCNRELPGDFETLLNLSWAWQNAADAHRALGDGTAAEAAFDAGARLATEAKTSLSANPDLKREAMAIEAWAIARQKIGDGRMNSGREEQALEIFEDATKQLRAVSSAAEPSSPTSRLARNVLMLLGKEATCALRLAEKHPADAARWRKQATARFREVLHERIRLRDMSTDPKQNATLRRDVFVTREKLAKAVMHENCLGAIELLEQAFHEAEQLHIEESQKQLDVRTALDCAEIRTSLGEAQHCIGRNEPAAEHARKAIEVLENLPVDLRLRELKIGAARLLAKVSVPEKESALRTAARTLRELRDQFPQSIEYQRQLEQVLQELGAFE